MTDKALHELTAEQAVDLLRKGAVTPTEMVEAAVSRIEAVDPVLNALPTRCVDRALERARAFERGASVPGQTGWLAGLPVAIKDLSPVEGVRTTYGSRVYADHIAPRSDLLVENLEASGAIVLAKSNTPEFGAGASTFNEVHGRTHSPWNTAKSVAGSSGGSAAALASGQVWLAHGSDLGGSLRTPASFNGIVGLRPSPGRVPRGLLRLPFDTAPSDILFVEGPMARTARDVALMLDAMMGAHPEDPWRCRDRPRACWIQWALRPCLEEWLSVRIWVSSRWSPKSCGSAKLRRGVSRILALRWKRQPRT